MKRMMRFGRKWCVFVAGDDEMKSDLNSLKEKWMC